jgi:predicted double-glycine peptidase
MEHFIPQFDEESCGLSSVRTLLYSLTGEKKFATLSLSSHPPYSLSDLSEAVEKYGYSLDFFKSEPQELDYPSNDKKPFIALLGDKKKTHAVVVFHLSKRKVRYYDPAVGMKKEKRSDFILQWTGIWGSAQKKDEEAIKEVPVTRPLVSLFTHLFVLTLLIIEQGCLLCGFFFISKEGNFLYPVLFFCLVALLEIARYFYLLTKSREFDKRYLDLCYSPDSERFKRNYQCFLSYKQNSLSGFSLVIQSLLSCLLLYFLLGVNLPSFFLSGGLVMAYIVGDSLISYYHLEREKGTLERLEVSLWEEGGKKEKLSSLSRLSLSSHHLGETTVYRRIISLVLVAFLSLLPLFLEKKVSLNLFLFIFMANIALGELTKKVLSFFYSHRERKATEGYFREYLLKKNPNK